MWFSNTLTVVMELFLEQRLHKHRSRGVSAETWCSYFRARDWTVHCQSLYQNPATGKVSEELIFLCFFDMFWDSWWSLIYEEIFLLRRTCQSHASYMQIHQRDLSINYEIQRNVGTSKPTLCCQGNPDVLNHVAEPISINTAFSPAYAGPVATAVIWHRNLVKC